MIFRLLLFSMSLALVFSPAAIAQDLPGLPSATLSQIDADVAVQELKTRGVKIFSPAQVYTLEGTVYQRYSALVSDPEGNLIEIGEAPEVQETPTKRKKSQSQ
jgi:hypothetical protein